MVDNYGAKDAAGTVLSFAAKLVGSVLVPRHTIVDETNTAVPLPAALGQGTMAQSLRVVLPSDQTWTGAANLGKAEDAAASSGDVGVVALGVRTDALAAQTSANGDYGAPSLDKFGASLSRSYEKQAATYSCGVNVTPASSATDVVVLSGSASKTVCVTKVSVSMTATAAGQSQMSLLKRSTADSAGTSSSPTIVAHDSGDAAASAVLKAYTANPTLGTLAGTIRQYSQPDQPTTAGQPTVVTWEFGDKGKPIILNGTAEQLALNLNGATAAGASLSVSFEWFEL